MPEISLTALIQFFGYPGLFAAVFMESGVFFGFFLPGASMLFTAGLLASQGFFNPWILIPGVTIAAILGDNTGYWFGNKIGIRLFLRPDSRFFRRSHLERAKEFYEKYGSRAIFLARFIPIVRTFAPIVAGIVSMKYRVFVTYNILGAVVWGAGVTFAGYYLGTRFPAVEQYLSYIILGIIFVTSIPIFIDIYRRLQEVPESKDLPSA
ncbi:MAG: VTT domain-containing protein [bacterium]|nr:VTT domain-containing protein [bacterium]